MPDTYPFKDFQSRLNQEFLIESEPGNWVPAQLVEASELQFTYAPATGEAPRVSFSLVFQAGSEVQLAQRIYTVKHEELGEVPIFLVPLQPDEQGTRYEAVFT